MIKPKVLVFSGYGLNCEEETKFAFDSAGAVAEIVHINDLIDGGKRFSDYRIIVFPGGFSYGDDTGSGNAFANKVRNHLWDKIKSFIDKDNLAIGICNGFQIMVNLGLLPAFDGNYGKRKVALLHNNNARYTVRWVDLKVTNKSPWLSNIKEISLPIAHGEGKFYADNKVVSNLNKYNQVALRYVKGEICNFQDLSVNPNGSLEDIAGITDQTGRVFGLMPHPERATFFTQLPHWTYLKEKFIREGKEISTYGTGLKIFQNAVDYFTE